MQYLTQENILAVIPWVVFVCTLIGSFLRARKAGKTTAEAMLVLVNSLKDESKMLPDGSFKPEMLDKVELAARTLEVSKDAREKAKDIIASGAHQDIKIGSIKGKPIYLGQIGGVLGIGGSLVGRVRDIWRGIKF